MDRELEILEAEARYHRERHALYRARQYSGKATSEPRLRELERAELMAKRKLKAYKQALRDN